VKGFAQREYGKLAKHLEAKLGRPVQVEFGESLKGVLEKKTGGRADLVIGKESVIRNLASNLKLSLTPAAALTDHDGKTTLTGLFVVPSKDEAISAADLKDHKILFGQPEADEKYSAAMTLMKDLGLNLPNKPETCLTCSVAATQSLDLFKKGQKSAAVISSYAMRLLEGCGTIQKGDLRVVGETDPVPFIVAFLNDQVSAKDQELVRAGLLSVGESKELCTFLETKSGFVKLDAKKK
jgi:ABC-type phosphate/phosphonate transport system substrate-binding protein